MLLVLLLGSERVEASGIVIVYFRCALTHNQRTTFEIAADFSARPA
jgi:hypothetical protein